ncbi:hypothetical protein A3860_25185 [Niastella vici]|uniref:Peptidase S74 domain-containing protein n=1 Tax=Niastella vici TaxID=1703345 RepID=A0A1V9FXW8_9BACT|nr:hypothetical protein [Niastella vici]OQP63187.1 hypothetical protein A3860_25185 [Niastella vici]
MHKVFLIAAACVVALFISIAWKGTGNAGTTPNAPFSGITQTCLSTHIYNNCGTAGYVTFGFGATTGAGTSAADPLTIQQSNMSVGVNAANPQAKLQIIGGGSDNNTSSFLVNNSVNTEMFRILDNGNIGIGISAPQSKLGVNGTITAKKVKVTESGWPDYVFDKNYELPNLQQVEQYITRYHHLPGVESEEEVTKNGVDLGHNQANLLKKIEELTLYVIQQNKELAQLKSENKVLATQQSALEKQQKEIDALKEIITRLAAKN